MMNHKPHAYAILVPYEQYKNQPNPSVKPSPTEVTKLHIMSMLPLPALFLLSGVLYSASAVDPVPTYEREDPLTGDTLICEKCPPGFHLVAHCTATTPTQCAPCKGEQFTEFWNYLPRCLYCSNFCFDNQEVQKECSAVNNRVCRCKEGFYYANDFCVEHTQCGPGHGVLTRGTSETNTLCVSCAQGFFSSSSSALDSCVIHQECANGQIVLLPGSVYHDTVCGTCTDLANGGETSRTFLSAFFSNHRMRVSKMKKFVARYIHKSGGERRIRGTVLPRQRGPLLDQIKAWLAESPDVQLKKLPAMLRATQLSSMAEKLERRLNEIKQHNCAAVEQ
ncbi:tumor necrosis factor receptor superfamily member 6B isoform X2 [Dicentrarchus labrax]|uniref:tumor necrosis factor receptor superfamily member 6B isoform X2 n=1 Tax=Dicentrarchus labrax TaxID=13489 RepID=UPI0021F58D93|nr:tumor necrosis factor receptor superfamily member 6B isoform X2 [Dicentrarchus labrax]